MAFDAFGERQTGNPAGDSYHQSVDHTSILIAALLGLTIFVFDVWFNFMRGAGYTRLFMLAYAMLAVLIYYQMAGGFRRDGHAFRFVLTRWAFATFAPFVLFLYQSQILNGFVGVLGAAAGVFLGLLSSVYFPLIIMYWGGFTHWLLDHAGRNYGFFRWINNAITLLIIFALLLVVFDTIETVPGVQQQTELEVPGFAKMWQDTKGLFVGLYEDTKVSVVGTVNGTVTAIAPPVQRGTVESTQGRDLGVFIRDLQPIPQVVQFRMDGDSLVPLDDVFIVYGTLEAQTLANDFPLTLSCVYTVGNRTLISVPASPSSLTVRYTGEFKDSYQFECVYDLRGLDVDERTDLNGRFEVVAEFPFDTWGYTTLTFMDRDTMRALRMEGTDPARYLGISPSPVVKYTPGPVGLGMETVNQPISIDPAEPRTVPAGEPRVNILPRFGIAIDNTWSARGEVTAINGLVLQVPNEFDLRYQDCTGTRSRPHVTPYGPRTGFSSLETVPDGYTWYEFQDIEFLSPLRQWLQCPIEPSSEWRDLLNPDLSARQYTLVARVQYDYRLTQPVTGARMAVVRG